MIVKYLSGEIPINVSAQVSLWVIFMKLIDNVSSIIEYSNNLTCNIWYSKLQLENRNGLKVRVYGETGICRMEFKRNLKYLHLADRRGNRWTLDRGSSEVNISNIKIRYTRFKAGHSCRIYRWHSLIIILMSQMLLSIIGIMNPIT